MAQATWVPGTRHLEAQAPARPVADRSKTFRLAGRLTWITAAAAVLVCAPAAAVLGTGSVQGPASTAPAAISQLAFQAEGILAPTNYQVTLPLQEALVTPVPTPRSVAVAGGVITVPQVAEPSRTAIEQIIAAAGAEYGVADSWLMSVAECESGLDPTAVNRSSGASGLFQFMPATFYGHGGTDLWDPTQQANIAAKMFSIGESGEWVCK